MGDWDSRMTELCESNCVEVDMSDRYVNNVDTIMKAIPHGYRWTGQRLKYDWLWELEDERIPLDQHTVNTMVAMANTIRPAIQMEGDCGSRHEDGHIPVLDIKIATILIHIPGDPETGKPALTFYQANFKFYKKPMACPTIMNARTQK